MTVVSVLQPSYLPWLGYFDLIDRSDVFVFYDDVQYDKNGWRNRNRINTAQGVRWLTVPVLRAGSFGQKLSHVLIDDRVPWAGKHLATLTQSYAKAPFRDTCLPTVADVISRRWSRLIDLDMELIHVVCRTLDMTAEFHLASELGISGDRSGRLLSICQAFGASTYLSTNAGQNYLDVDHFRTAGVEVQWQDYRHPEYPQHRGGFEDHLSVVDLLFEAGPESAAVIRSGRPPFAGGS